MALGAPKKAAQAIGKPRRGRNSNVNLFAADARTALTFSPAGGRADDAPEGRDLRHGWRKPLLGLPCRLIGPVIAKSPGNLFWTRGSNWSSRPKPTAKNLGI